MSVGEDAATILDDFIHEVANLPAEIQHLLEEIQAKDVRVRDHQQQIEHRDLALQKHVKQMGGHVKHPKEEQMMKSARDHYEVALKLQDEKLAMSQKSCSLVSLLMTCARVLRERPVFRREALRLTSGKTYKD